MLNPFVGEFMGTMVLVLLGDGVVAGTLLRRSKAENSGWIVITAGWAFALFCGMMTAIACGSPEAHLNPAVTLAVAIKTGDFSQVIMFITAQVLGAMGGATLMWLFYYPHWELTSDKAAKLATFCTGPAIRRPLWNLCSEVIGTSILILVSGALGSRALIARGGSSLLVPHLTVVVWGIGLSLGGTTGYAINPARDLGPRIAHSILPIAGKGASDWGYASIPVVGPIVGAVLMSLFLRVLKL